jgi:hypothetical protein
LRWLAYFSDVVTIPADRPKVVAFAVASASEDLLLVD